MPNDWLHFDVRIHPLPASREAVVTQLEGTTFSRLQFDPRQLTDQFQWTFEELGDILASQDSLFFEPDGSFVWRGQQDGSGWQLDGHLFDRSGRLLFIELAGHCPQQVLTRFKQLLSEKDSRSLMYEWVREGVYVDESGFNVLASRPRS